MLLLISCGRDGTVEGVRTHALTQRDDGTTIEARAGDRIQVTLDANQTTPFRWHLSKVPDPAIVDLLSSVYDADPNPEELVGSGGTSIWTFEANGPGTTTIGLAYVEIGSDPPNRPDFAVTVQATQR